MANYSRISTLFYLARSYASFVTTGTILPVPRILQIQTISSCNGHCMFCPYIEVHRSLAQGTMETALFYKIIDEVIAEPCFSEVLFELHNEPLLDNRTFQFIEYVKSRNKKKACTLVTNGQLIDKFDLCEIMQSNVDRFVISLNAHSPKMYEHISGGLDYERIKKNISAVLSKAELKTKLTLSFVNTEQTENEINQAIRYWKERGIRTRVINIANRAGVLENFESMRPKTRSINYSLLERNRKYMGKKMSNATGCYKPLLEMTILFNGDVILCCQDWKRTTVLGNVNESSLKEIWNSPKFNDIRRLIMKKKYSQINLCKDCSEVR